MCAHTQTQPQRYTHTQIHRHGHGDIDTCKHRHTHKYTDIETHIDTQTPIETNTDTQDIHRHTGSHSQKPRGVTAAFIRSRGFPKTDLKDKTFLVSPEEC